MVESLLNQFWLKPISIPVAIAACAITPLAAYQNESPVASYILGGICFCLLVLYIILVIRNCMLPKVASDHLGILFVIFAESKSIRDEFEYKIRDNLKNNTHTDKVVEPVFITEGQVKNYDFHNKEIMINLLEKTRCVFCVELHCQVDSVSDCQEYSIKINAGILHPKVSSLQEKVINIELATAARPIKKLKFTRSQKIDCLQITAQHIHAFAKYMVAIVSLLSGDSQAAVLLFRGIYELDCKASFPSVDNWYYLACIAQFHEEYSKYEQTKSESCLQQARMHLEWANTILPDTYNYHLDMALIEFLQKRDIPLSKKHIAECKKLARDDDAWKYSDAFLEAYTSNSAWNVYRKYKATESSKYNMLEIINFIEEILDVEPQKTMLHLALGLLYHRREESKLTYYHLTNFQEQYTYTVKDKTVEKEVRAIIKTHSACSRCNCDNCDTCKSHL